MLHETLQRWRSQLPRNAPLVASVTLAALVATELLHIGFVVPLLVHSGSLEGKPADLAGSRVDAPGPTTIDAGKIMGAHLFGDASDSGKRAVGVPVPSTAANLQLTGTIAAKNPKRGAAIVRGDGKSAIYKVGADLGGAAVDSVYKDRIVLNRDGRLEVLLMPRALTAADGSDQSDASRAGAESPSPAESARELANVVRVGAAESNEAGQIRGFRIFPGNDRSAFSGAGLRAGDLVVAVNGSSVIDKGPQNGQDAFASIGHAARATVTIERQGRTTDVTIDVDSGS